MQLKSKLLHLLDYTMRLTIYVLFFFIIGFFVFVMFASKGTLEDDEYFELKTDHSQYDSRSTEDTFSVVTYNIGYLSGMTNNLPLQREKKLFTENLQRAIGLLDSIDADIVGVQEVDMDAARSYRQNQVDSLATALQYPIVYQSVNWDKKYVPFPYWPISRHFGRMLSGQATFSVFPITSQQTITLQKPINAPPFYNTFYLDRLVQVTQVAVAEDTICVMNLHLEAFDKETRLAQAHVVKALYEEYAEEQPVLLIGDFNSRPGYVDTDDAMSIIMTSSGIQSAVSQTMYQADSTSFYTFDSASPYQMIDYILYNEAFIRPVHVSVLTEAGEISDHLPVYMSYVLVPQNDQN